MQSMFLLPSTMYSCYYTIPTPVTELHVHNKCTVEPRYSFSYMYETNLAIVYVTGQIFYYYYFFNVHVVDFFCSNYCSCKPNDFFFHVNVFGNKI